MTSFYWYPWVYQWDGSLQKQKKVPVVKQRTLFGSIVRVAAENFKSEAAALHTVTVTTPASVVTVCL